MSSDPYRQYFESMPCYLSVQNRDFRIIDANSRFVENFGEYEDRYCYQVYKQRPDKCEVCPVEQAFQDGQCHRSEEKVCTLSGREVHVIVNATPIKDAQGNITAVMEMSTDVTELKRLQKQLDDSQKRYRLLFEEVPCYISIQDRNLNIVDANRMHREAFGTFYGCKCYKVYKHRKKECAPCVVRQTFEDGNLHVHEEVVTDQNGKRVNVVVTTAPLHNSPGEIEYVMEMSADITQIRQLQSKLASIGMIIGTISHDLKGLLNGLDGGLYLVDTGLKTDKRDRVDRGWEMMSRNVDRIRSTVSDILYYAKDRMLEWEEVTVKDVFEEISEVLRAKADLMDVEFSIEVTDDSLRLEADRKAFRSLILNLVDNAFDACRKDKNKPENRVNLTVSDAGDYLRFSIEDNGIGMDRETREKAFTLFFSSKGSGGTGLGLFIANKIALAHGGKIEVESNPGQGTHFSVLLPKKTPASVKNMTTQSTEIAVDTDRQKPEFS